MKHTPSLKVILLVVVLLVMFGQVSSPVAVWDERLVPVGRVRQACNPKRNQERWARHWRRWQRQQPQVSRARRRRQRLHLMQQMLKPIPGGTAPTAGLGQVKRLSDKPDKPTAEPQPPDPLADLRQQRGWIDRMSERELWRLLIRLRWPHGTVCPCCLEHDPQYVKLLDPDYRDGLGRWRCLVCAEAGDAGEGGTFTPLTGTLLEGTRLDARTMRAGRLPTTTSASCWWLH